MDSPKGVYRTYRLYKVKASTYEGKVYLARLVCLSNRLYVLLLSIIFLFSGPTEDQLS